jgi:hypothetical protein
MSLSRGNMSIHHLFSPWICVVLSVRKCLTGWEMSPDYPLVPRVLTSVPRRGKRHLLNSGNNVDL